MMSFLTARKIIVKCKPVAVLCANVCVMSPVELKGESSHKKTKPKLKKHTWDEFPPVVVCPANPDETVKGAHALQSNRSPQTH